MKSNDGQSAMRLASAGQILKSRMRTCAEAASKATEDVRVDALMSKMTLKEKISFTRGVDEPASSFDFSVGTQFQLGSNHTISRR